MIELNILPDGNLKITLLDKAEFLDYFDISINEETKEIQFNNGYPSVRDVLEASGYIGNNWYDCTDLIGLTSSPIIGYDVEIDDNGKYIFTNEDTKLWWFPNYQIENEWKTLLNNGSVIFTQALD